MTIKVKSQTRPSKIKLDLTGPDGNALVIMGTCKSIARQLGWTDEKTKAVLEDMMRGDYSNVIRLADLHFGAFLEMEMNEPLLEMIQSDITEHNSQEVVEALLPQGEDSWPSQ